MFKIQRIDVNNENAKNDFFASFQNTGFAVMEDHGISFELIDKVYEEWKQFLILRINTITNSIQTHKMVFPFRSKSAKDNPIKDLKNSL